MISNELQAELDAELEAEIEVVRRRATRTFGSEI